MAASFPNSLKTWTPVVDTVTDMLGSQINTLYDEVTAIETKLREGDDGKFLGISSGVPTWQNVVSESTNVETLSTTKTLVATDATWQFLNPNGASRDINLPTGSASCFKFYFKNTGATDFNLVIKYSSTTLITVRYNSSIVCMVWNGTTWIATGFNTTVNLGNSSYAIGSGVAIGDGTVVPGGTGVAIGKNSSANDRTVAIGESINAQASGQTYGQIGIGYSATINSYGIAIGYTSKSNYNNYGGTAIGYNAKGGNANNTSSYATVGGGVSLGAYSGADSGSGDPGVSIGSNANGTSTGVALGHYSLATGYGVGLGARTNTNSKNYAIAKGFYSKCERWNEEWKCSDGASTNKYGNGNLNWHGVTTDVTETEIFLGGTSNQRATVLASSAFMFKFTVIAYNVTDNVGSTWNIMGGIKRDASNNTSLIGSVSKTQTSFDVAGAAWDVTVTADDTNEALKVTVTGAAGKTIRWNIHAITSEVRF
jgi:hypothetical protein